MSPPRTYIYNEKACTADVRDPAPGARRRAAPAIQRRWLRHTKANNTNVTFQMPIAARHTRQVRVAYARYAAFTNARRREHTSRRYGKKE